MTDTVIKGGGNSRSLKTVPNALTMYPTHEAMIAAMVDGSFPIDLGPLNDAGLRQHGTDLNKANLLSDETAALYGKDASAVPDDVLAAIIPLIAAAGAKADRRAQIILGSYVGDGDFSKGKTILFPGYPVLVGIADYAFIRPSLLANLNSTMNPSLKAWGENSLTLYNYTGNNSPLSLNTAGTTYNYYAVIQ